MFTFKLAVSFHKFNTVPACSRYEVIDLWRVDLISNTRLILENGDGGVLHGLFGSPHKHSSC